MKKLLAITLAFALYLGLLAGCGSTAADSAAASEAASTETVQSAAAETAETAADEAAPAAEEAASEEGEGSAAEPADENIAVTNAWTYDDGFGDTLVFLTVQNNSEAILDITGTATAEDADGNSVTAEGLEINAVSPGEEGFGCFYFESVSGAENVEYEFECTESQYVPILGDIALEETPNNSNVTIMATNNGTSDAQLLTAYGLFFDADGNLVDYDVTDLTDVNCVLAVGESVAGTLTCFTDDGYDSEVIYLIGYSDGTVLADSDSAVSDADFETTDYVELKDYGSSVYVELTNNSAVSVTVWGNGVLEDADSNLVAATNVGIEVIGPGETALCQFYFDGITDADFESYDYQFSYSENVYAESLVSDMDVQSEFIDDTTLSVTITNQGEADAEWVEVYILGFDADGNVTDIYEEIFAGAGSDALKSGDSVSSEYYFDETVVSTSVYTTAYRYISE